MISGLSNLNINSLAVSGSNLFAGTGGGAFLSTDNGATWNSVNIGLTNSSVYSIAISGSDIYAGTGDGVFYSSNNGTSWTQVSNGLVNRYIYTVEISGTNLYAGTFGAGVYIHPIMQPAGSGQATGSRPAISDHMPLTDLTFLLVQAAAEYSYQPTMVLHGIIRG